MIAAFPYYQSLQKNPKPHQLLAFLELLALLCPSIHDCLEQRLHMKTGKTRERSYILELRTLAQQYCCLVEMGQQGGGFLKINAGIPGLRSIQST